MPKRLTQDQKLAVTAALFRREPYPQIAATHGVSERRLRGISLCLRTWGTTHPPRMKQMGRPKAITSEIQEGLREYVNSRPLSSLQDMQSHIQKTFNAKCSFRSISLCLKDMGYIRTIVQRGNRSLEKDNLPSLSESDKLRIQSDPAAAKLLDKPKVIYAWLLTPNPNASLSKLATKKSASAKKARRGASAGRRSQELSDDERDEEESLDVLLDGDISAAALIPAVAQALPSFPLAASQSMG
ncbi:hypothetical protein PAAG_04748 [Paracoccidioides lutzii Pb01]|uniref:Uncharacterized protein n=1 Tax=Paracoccidioides lutzii (strain ATCC MYA-826 / Pb01) TaxID=502779 RepID=C1H2B9_PARBA|nr:hypothetical protein PAAG_04748 [Paracoccidioides lutzii Pb01]EEH33699.1 hypothetical protein PAAG_04748 [Paracoccidioides lutzii Pb01]